MIKERYNPNKLEAGEESLKKESRPYKLNFDVITISGPSGTGKSTAATELSIMLGIKSRKVGALFRDQVKQRDGEGILGYAKRTTAQDRDLDTITEEWIQEAADRGKPMIVEGRLAARNARKRIYESTGRIPIVVSILLDADQEVRIDRVLHREVKNNPNLTREKVAQATEDRDSKDLIMWQKTHKDLKGNPLHMDAVDQKDFWLYNLTINATDLTVLEVIEAIMEYLKEQKYIEVKGENEKTQKNKLRKEAALPSEGIICQED